MSSYAWTALSSWVLVAAVTVGAHVFGREARWSPASAAEPHAVRRSRLGVALSITGPLVVFFVGLLAAVVTGHWFVIGLVTVLALVAVALAGLWLAPA